MEDFAQNYASDPHTGTRQLLLSCADEDTFEQACSAFAEVSFLIATAVLSSWVIQYNSCLTAAPRIEWLKD